MSALQPDRHAVADALQGAAGEHAPERRRRLEPDARRAQILSCAVRLFGRYGYEAVSTTQVALTAGVARGLVNHYFGTKKELYLEVVRALLTLPDVVVEAVPPGSLSERVDVTVSWFLDAVLRLADPWLAVVGATGPGSDPELVAVIGQADERTVDHILALAGFDPAQAAEPLRAATRAYVAFARAGAAQWVRGSLSRDQVHLLLTSSLIALLGDIAPRLALSADTPAPAETPASSTDAASPDSPASSDKATDVSPT